ncbi:MAG: hypothetical protein ACREYF_20275 [Gammaproteobacteria bacterium]
MKGFVLQGDGVVFATVLSAVNFIYHIPRAEQGPREQVKGARVAYFSLDSARNIRS